MWLKLGCVIGLAGLAIFLQFNIWQAQDYLHHLQQQQQQQQSTTSAGNGDDRNANTDSSSTVQSIQLDHINDDNSKGYSSRRAAALAFWNLALSYGPDSTLETVMMSDSSFHYYNHNIRNATLAQFYLEKAAQAGHATAQFHLGNTQSAGFSFWGDNSDQPFETEKADYSHPPTSAWLHWHMAALGGNIEAATLMAQRLTNTMTAGAGNNNNNKLTPSVCTRTLPYWSAAAHGIMDIQLSNPDNRGRWALYRDRHVLYQVHLHGGTTSRLDADNRPDERPEALQYYAVRASNKATEPDEAARAAFALARFYHTGLRGAPQNATLARQYYTQAGFANHWEAAGRAGMMAAWGMGGPRDLVQAHKLFTMGAPGGVDGCTNRWQRRKTKNNKNEAPPPVSMCDNSCLTGMGLLHLWGVPMLAPVHVGLAKRYLELAKSQGDADAFYYLAMLKLGLYENFVTRNNVEELMGEQHQDDNTESSSSSSSSFTDWEEAFLARLEELGAATADNRQRPQPNHLTVPEFQSVMTDLATASGKGHLLARHRLGLIYEHGVRVDGATHIIAPDCSKAVQHYQYLVENACPFRNQRLRKGYKAYMAGDSDQAVRHYLIAAETGSDLALLNAAFLLDEGACMGLDAAGCAQSAVRLWKAAAERGFSEASLRVGDFYYYGGTRKTSTTNPVLDLQQLLWFPERFLLRLVQYSMDRYKQWSKGEEAPETCGHGTCLASEEENDEATEGYLNKAAYYYRMAAERNASPRAHFNLGYLYEWGLGLKQDFPLAKRHYDLAISTGPEEAEVPVTLALYTLNAHEYLVKKYMALQDWREHLNQEPTASSKKSGDTGTISTKGKTKIDVILRHLFSWESLAILVLTVIFSKLLQMRQHRTR